MNGAAELGPRLRAERERRGISVQKAADELRLDAWAIEALETDQFDRLGAAVFAKGHLKQYAALLGLPFDEIAASYESRKPRAAEPPAAAPETRARPLPSLAHLLPWRRFAVPALLLALIVGVLRWKPWHAAPGPPPARRPHVEAPAAPAAAAPDGPAAGMAPAAAVARAPATAAQTVPKPAAVPAGTVHLRLMFTVDSWIDVHDALGKRLYTGVRSANTALALTGQAPVSVVLGFARGVRLEIDGRAAEIGPTLVSGNVARFDVGADGVMRRHADRSRPQN